MQMMADMRMQFLDLLSDIGFIDKSKGPKVSKHLFPNMFWLNISFYMQNNVPPGLVSNCLGSERGHLDADI